MCVLVCVYVSMGPNACAKTGGINDRVVKSRPEGISQISTVSEIRSRRERVGRESERNSNNQYIVFRQTRDVETNIALCTSEAYTANSKAW